MQRRRGKERKRQSSNWNVSTELSRMANIPKDFTIISSVQFVPDILNVTTGQSTGRGITSIET